MANGEISVWRWGWGGCRLVSQIHVVSLFAVPSLETVKSVEARVSDIVHYSPTVKRCMACGCSYHYRKTLKQVCPCYDLHLCCSFFLVLFFCFLAWFLVILLQYSTVFHHGRREEFAIDGGRLCYEIAKRNGSRGVPSRKISKFGGGASKAFRRVANLPLATPLFLTSNLNRLGTPDTRQCQTKTFLGAPASFEGVRPARCFADRAGEHVAVLPRRGT